jgi:hypothetical protein
LALIADASLRLLPFENRPKLAHSTAHSHVNFSEQITQLQHRTLELVEAGSKVFGFSHREFLL